MGKPVRLSVVSYYSILQVSLSVTKSTILCVRKLGAYRCQGQELWVLIYISGKPQVPMQQLLVR